MDASTVKDVRSELTLIRDKINGLLEALDITTKVPSAQSSSEQPQQLSTGMVKYGNIKFFLSFYLPLTAFYLAHVHVFVTEELSVCRKT